MAAKSKKTTGKTAGKLNSDQPVDVGYFRNFRERVARSEGFEAGYAGRPRSSCRYTGQQAEAWNDGYNAAIQ
ncbi:MAG: hypothetical protein E6Q40_08810 [Cupriavidus sp.]|nr:MAG: hypothetical protein E6Q40_08810 [Cupriavidus sp.]